MNQHIYKGSAPVFLVTLPGAEASDTTPHIQRRTSLQSLSLLRFWTLAVLLMMGFYQAQAQWIGVTAQTSVSSWNNVTLTPASCGTTYFFDAPGSPWTGEVSAFTPPLYTSGTWTEFYWSTPFRATPSSTTDIVVALSAGAFGNTFIQLQKADGTWTSSIDQAWVYASALSATVPLRGHSTAATGCAVQAPLNGTLSGFPLSVSAFGLSSCDMIKGIRFAHSVVSPSGGAAAEFVGIYSTTTTTTAAADVPTVSAISGTTTICSGDAHSLSVTATGSSLTYNWQFSDNGGASWSPASSYGAFFSGYNTATLNALTGTDLASVNGRQYRVQVTNSCGTINSTAVTMTINSAPAVGTPTGTTTICSGAAHTLTSATPSGTAPFTYNWQFQEAASAIWGDCSVYPAAFTGYNTAALNILAGVDLAGFNGRKYRVQVTNSCGTVNSTQVTMTINSPPTLSTVANSTICAGGTATFTVTPSGTAPFTYKWQFSDNGGVNWADDINGTYAGSHTGSGVGTSILTYSNVTAARNGRRFQVLVTNSCGTVTSNAATLTVNSVATPTLSSTTATNICPATTVNLNSLVTGSAPAGASLQWFTNSAHTGTAYATPTTAAAGTYYAFYFNGTTGCYSTATAAVNASVTTCVPVCNAGNVAPVLSSTSGCGSSFNLPSLVTSTAPAGTAIEFHTSATPTAGNLVANPSAAAPGTYYAFYHDATNNCYSPNSQVIIVADPVAPTLSATSATNECGSTTASLTGVVSSTTPADATLEFHTSATPTAGNLVTDPSVVAAGTYYAFYYTTGGCYSPASGVITVTITALPDAPTASVTAQPTCTIGTGTITVTAPTDAGTTYSIDGVNYQSSATFIGVPPGSYSVTVRNSIGCTSTSTIVTVDPAPVTSGAPTATVTAQPTCAVNTGTISVTAPTGAGVTYSIDGIFYQTSATFIGVGAGSYDVTAKEGTCTSAITTVTVNAAPDVPATPTATVTVQPTCEVNTGTIDISAPTGAGITYSIDGVNYQTSPTFTGVAPGTYTVTAQNASCTSIAVSVTINVAPPCLEPPTAEPIAFTIAQPLSGDIINLGTHAPQGDDPEDGELGGPIITSTLVITQLFTNGVELYYNGVLVTLNQEITNFRATDLTVKLVGFGYTSTTGRYAFRDSHGLLGTDAPYTITWSSPLPVTLASFSATKEGAVAQLKWTTTQETNADRFEIQRSADAKQWSAIGEKVAAGESKALQSYFFTDSNPLKGSNYYRLKMIDIDKTFAYSRIQSVELNGAGTVSLYPNPVSDRLFLKDFNTKNLKEISIVDMNGKVVYASSEAVTGDGINVSSLGDGIYIVKVAQLDGTLSTHKIVISK